MAAGMLAAIAASSAIAADASASWSGPKLTTTPMSAADAAAIDELAQDALASNPDLPGMWIGIWEDCATMTRLARETLAGGGWRCPSLAGRWSG